MTFVGTVNSQAVEANDLAITAGGNITFTGAVGDGGSALGDLLANSTGTTLFNSTVNAFSLTTDVEVLPNWAVT